MIVKVFDRAMYPGMGDAYSKVWRDINAWEADCAVHVHQDAGPPGARGYSVLYYRSLDFARRMDTAFYEVLSVVGVPRRGRFKRNDVAVLRNAAMPAVLVECGFYTSPEDEAVGVEPYAQAIALGVRRFMSSGKVAIAASLQGFPEEYDTDTEDATRIARRAAELLGEHGEEGGDEEMPVLQYDRDGGDLGKGVWVLSAPVESGATLVIYADRPAHDYAVNIYVVPIVGKIIGPRRVMIGGYGNRDNVHGGVFPLSQFGSWNGKAWITVHASVPIHGGTI